MSSKIILVLLPTLSLTIEQRVSAGVSQVLDGSDYKLLFVPLGYLPENEAQLNTAYYQQLTTLEPDLILCMGINLFSFSTESVLDKVLIHFKGIPLVNLGSRLQDYPSIVLNNFEGMYTLMSHVIQRRPEATVIYISGPPKNIDSLERFSALEAALKDVGRKADEVRILAGDYTTKVARDLFSEYLKKERLPDLVVCANDLMAMGVFEVLASTPYRCPDDVWVTGFDDFEYARFMSPSLSTVHYQAQALGDAAIRLGLNLLAGQDVEKCTVLTPDSVLRESTGDGMPELLNSEPFLLEQWALLYQRDNNSRKLSALRNFRRRMPIPEMLQVTHAAMGDLNVQNLSIYVQSINENGDTVFQEYNSKNNHVRQHVNTMVMPDEFCSANKNAYWVICPLVIEGSNYGYMVSQSTPIAAEFIEFIAPHFTELLHSEALEARNERYRVQTELNERMVSLGSLVSGVAHEVNTPIGTCKLASSSIIEAVARLKEKVESQSLTKTAFDDFLHDIDELSNVVFHSSDRAAELITNFKMVSVDQTAESMREIALDEYLDSVLMSLRHQLKKKKITLETEFEPGIRLKTYPGAIAQVVTNLFMNSLKHGFEFGKREGAIRITLKKTPSGFMLICSDNGRGATETVLKHIFDPFFTTTRAQGGTGLGMHIVFNLVTQKLHWTIQVESKPMQGFTVILQPLAGMVDE